MDISKIDQIKKLARDIADGKIGNHASRGQWYSALQKLAEQERRSGETFAQSFTRIVTSDTDGKLMFKAMRAASGSDVQQPEPEPALVLKSGTAYARLHDIAAGFIADDPSLTRHQAFAKAYDANPSLAQAAKREQVFA